MKSDYVVVCLSQEEAAKEFIPTLSALLKQFSRSLTSSGKILNISIDPSRFDVLNSALIHLSKLHRVDIGLIPKTIFETPKKLVIFDMDATLITAEVIDEMAQRFGVGDQVKLITSRAMNGELDFNQSLTERVSLLKGFDQSLMQEILQGLTFTPGTSEFIQKLKFHGIKTAIASGGFDFFAKNLKLQLGMDYVFANNLESENGHLTGKILGSIINAEAKERIVIDLAQKESLKLTQVVAIGDGANDIPMLLKAGLGIAVNAKEKVQLAARHRINFGPMTHALGYMNL